MFTENTYVVQLKINWQLRLFTVIYIRSFTDDLIVKQFMFRRQIIGWFIR